MTLDIEVFRDETDGQLKVFIADENGSGCHYNINSLDEAGGKVAEYISDNFEDDGADVVYKVR